MKEGKEKQIHCRKRRGNAAEVLTSPAQAGRWGMTDFSNQSGVTWRGVAFAKTHWKKSGATETPGLLMADFYHHETLRRNRGT
jgi:hypothetical protein